MLKIRTYKRKKRHPHPGKIFIYMGMIKERKGEKVQSIKQTSAPKIPTDRDGKNAAKNLKQQTSVPQYAQGSR